MSESCTDDGSSSMSECSRVYREIETVFGLERIPVLFVQIKSVQILVLATTVSVIAASSIWTEMNGQKWPCHYF